jgi:hypothetical protein
LTAIDNVGELASSYFLLEVWARRADIDIDPETFATLRRKAKGLVRDARVAESRQEPPDADWQARRLEWLGLDPLASCLVTLAEGEGFELGRWVDAEGRDCVLVADLTGVTDPDRREEGASDPVSTRFELALDAYTGDSDWGLLLAGLEVRLYRRSAGISQQYLALHLDTLVDLDDETTWKAAAALFRAPAFVPDDSGVALVRRVVDEGRRHAAALADDMRADVVDAAEALIQGAFDHPANATMLGQPNPSRALLARAFEESLYYLYRVLFVLFAEAREVLPVSAGGPYATTYSLDHLVELARTEPEGAAGSYYQQAVHRLFDLLWRSSPATTRALGFDAVGGELFDPARTKLLDSCSIGDPAWRRALTSIALGAPRSARRRMGRRSSFAELGVDQLGSIYEGLLVLEPYLAPGPRILVTIKGERRVLEPEAPQTGRVHRTLGAGDFVLESASGRRKGSGSFYTPAEITEYLVHAALDPLIEPILTRAADDPEAARAAVLDLRVCDPAMGSGAFLVQAARALALGAARARAAGSDGRVTPYMVHRAKREVLRRCLYGVDLNPLAVVLAKVSLWLETLEKGLPLSFLDAHLRCGDSLVGVQLNTQAGGFSVAELSSFPEGATKGLVAYLTKEAGEVGAPLLARLQGRRRRPERPGQIDMFSIPVDQALAEITEQRDALVCWDDDCDTLESEREAALSFEAMEVEESLRNRLRWAADLWCAQWFSDGEDTLSPDGQPVAPLGPDGFYQAVGALLRGEPVPPSLTAALEAAEVVAGRRRFFHWVLEFPEVLVSRGGFDAVIGNPPWNTLSPGVDEFFSTFDPATFCKGAPKPAKSARQRELRTDPDIDAAWRAEARWLHELSAWAKPEAGRYKWYAPDGQLRKGDANVYRLFVERAYGLLRPGGHLAQVLPDSVYISSPATGVRKHLLGDGVLERCWVFENRREIFPIHRSTKVVLLTARRGGGPTQSFRAAFWVGKDAAGRERAVGLDELPGVLADLDREAPVLGVDQLRALAPETWSFPELQTALDAEIAAQVATSMPALNLDEAGWGLTYCAELHADRDAWRFHDAAALEARGAVRAGLRWRDPDGFDWWPLVEGVTFYQMEFPAEGKAPTKWVKGPDVRGIEGRRNPDGTSVTEHYRLAWRLVASSTNERTVVAAVLPPSSAAKHSSPTTWGGLLDGEHILGLSAVLCSFCYDYLLRFGGQTNLTLSVLNSVPAPRFETLSAVVPLAAEVVCRSAEFDDLWHQVRPGEPRPHLDHWALAERRATIDAEVALAYGLSLEQLTAILCTFPNLDRSQPMLPGEPKSFVTRDLALLAYCNRTGQAPADITKLLEAIGVDLPEPRPDLRRLDARVTRARELGAVPYRPTPKGGRTPTDPELVAAVVDLLAETAQTAAELAEALEEDPTTVAALLKALVRDGDAWAEGRGVARRYYVIDDS